ncbi:helix-turn-helix transcriptional regulator [Svornostia abyssi]|uniref:Helix-turn-helix transcriptional regulator n=1 Tax=Svornostia abyssi TaxID=2898438 RepID=A0ABY5PLE8_9ACTN|nr:helix-turn-helix transcriptional regulator [Parviterribacteraceae bacterium J379]
MSDPAALGQFLQARRAERTPAAAGLPAWGRRRTPGLRREELAALAGVSIDYLTRLEQGRHAQPSPDVLSALASALGLTDAARAHLFLLAGRPDPGPVVLARDDVPGPVRRLVERADPFPAWVLNRRRDLLVWNEGATALLGDLAAMDAEQRNQLRLVFTTPAARALWADWPLVAQDTVAQLRAVTGPAGADPEVAALVADLSAASPEFAELWARHDVAPACSPLRAAHHPEAGELRFDLGLFDAAGGDLQVVVAEPHDDATQSRWTAFMRGRLEAGRLHAL